MMCVPVPVDQHRHLATAPRLNAKAPLTVRDARGQSLLHVGSLDLLVVTGSDGDGLRHSGTISHLHL